MTTKSNPKIDLSIVLPTYNEKENIGPIIQRLLRLCGEHSIEILVMDDNSQDGTRTAAENASKGDSRVSVVNRLDDRGLANSIRDGMERSSGNVIVVMDTDFNHPPEDVPILFEFAQHVDMVIGSRFIFGGGMPNRARYYLSYLYNIFMRLALGTRMDDNLSGFFSIRKAAFEKLDHDKIFWGYGDYFFRLLLLSQRAKLRHVQVPVFYGLRESGDAKTRFVSIFTQYTIEVFRLIGMRIAGKW